MASISEIFGLRVQQADGTAHRWNELMGVELELEDVEITGNPDLLYSLWEPHSDNSLRNGSEFVTARPMSGDTLERAISAFYETPMNFTKGPRTSTHIHINMTNSTSEVLQSMFVLMYTLEAALYSVVEESRKWGGYAMPLCEMSNLRIRNLLAPASSQQMITAIAPTRNQERYYGFNTNVRRHGTVEFRYFPGGPSKEELVSWIDFVSLIKKAATKYSVTQLINMVYDEHSLRRFLIEEMDYWGPKLLNAVNATAMYQSFNEVASMASDTDNRELPSGLVFVTSSFLGYIITKILKKDAKATEYIKKVVEGQSIMSKNEWNHYLSNARDMMGSRSKKQLSSSSDDDDDDYRDYHDDDDDEDLRAQWQEEPVRIPEYNPAPPTTNLPTGMRRGETYAEIVARLAREQNERDIATRATAAITTLRQRNARVTPTDWLEANADDLFSSSSLDPWTSIYPIPTSTPTTTRGNR